MEQNIKDLYDFVGSLDNTDLSDVPQTGEKMRLTDTEFFYALLKFYEPSVARIILFEGGKKHRADSLLGTKCNTHFLTPDRRRRNGCFCCL